MLAKIKPPWLSWLGVCALLLQVLVGVLFLYAFLGNSLGFLKPPAGAVIRTLELDLGAAAMGILMLWASAGIYRNRWWAYLLELILYCVLLAAMILIDMPDRPEKPHNEIMRIPFKEELQAIMSLAFMVWAGWFLIERTCTLYREQRSKR